MNSNNYIQLEIEINGVKTWLGEQYYLDGELQVNQLLIQVLVNEEINN